MMPSGSYETLPKPHLVILSAPSGAGKSTLCQRLLKDFPNLVLSISSTTRAPRGKEQNGVDYFFLTPESFQDQIQRGRFAEWAQVHGNYYGTSKDVIEATFQQGRSVLLDIDVQGAEQLKQAYPENCLMIFIAPPSLKELENRLRARGTDREEVIQKRLKNAEKELQSSHRFDQIIINDSLERAYEELRSYVQAHLHLPMDPVESSRK